MHYFSPIGQFSTLCRSVRTLTPEQQRGLFSMLRQTTPSSHWYSVFTTFDCSRAS